MLLNVGNISYIGVLTILFVSTITTNSLVLSLLFSANVVVFIKLYLLLNDEDEWVEVEKSDGVWIAHNSIKWINFMEDR